MALPLYPGLQIAPETVLGRLSSLGYVPVKRELRVPGEFRYDPRGRLEVHLRAFDDPAGRRPPVAALVSFAFGRVTALETLHDHHPLDAIELEPEAIAGIYDGEWEDRHVVTLRDVPAMFVYALLAAEDRRFFEHPGIDVRGVARALLANLRSRRIVQGGSTLSQQLVKNFFLTEARTFKRKVVEAVMTLLLERRFEKLEILELYLNEIYLGQRGAAGVFGVWEGSRFYFGKEPKDLTLGEVAMLAGLIKAPGRYAPTRNAELARRRRDEVLRALLRSRHVDAEEYRQALREPLPQRLPTMESAEAPYFVDYVRGELQKGFSDDDLTAAGLRVFTTLDPRLQREAERAVGDGLTRLEERFPRLERAAAGHRLQAALVALEPRSGEIKAMVGGRSYQESQFNRASQARRQPGSVFKPVVFLAAFREEERSGDGRYRPTRRIDDSPFRWDYDGRQWMPANYRGEYRGEVSLRQALELSLNTATARLAHEVGLERIRDMAVRLGLADDLPLLPSIVLGSAEVTPLDVAEAYATIANLGFRTGTTAIRTVATDEAPPPPTAGRHAEQVVSPRVAYLVTSLLEGVVHRGTGRSARHGGVRGPLAGKTGTTNDARDAWFVGFTPDLLAVVWVGFDQRDPLPVPASEAALPIWTDFMKAATGDSTPTPFLVPPGVEIASIDPASGALATSRCPERIEETFLEGEAPRDACPLHPDPGGVVAQPVDAPVTSFGIPAVEVRKSFSPPEALPLRQARP